MLGRLRLAIRYATIAGSALAILSGMQGMRLDAQRIAIPQHLNPIHPRISTRPGGSLAEMRVRLANDPEAQKAVHRTEAELAPYLAFSANAALRDIVPQSIAELPLPTIVVRQQGEAWARPFLSVFEPSDASKPGTISSVREIKAEGNEPGFAGLEVTERDGSQQEILSEVDASREVNVNGIRFTGSYGVLSKSSNEEWMLLGAGKQIFREGVGVVCSSDHAAAAVLRRGTTWSVMATEPCTLSVPVAAWDKAMSLRLQTADGARKVIAGEHSTISGHEVISFPIPRTPLIEIQPVETSR